MEEVDRLMEEMICPVSWSVIHCWVSMVEMMAVDVWREVVERCSDMR